MNNIKKQKKTWVYIDGFNLYYGACRRLGYKWIDLNKMCNKLLTSHNNIEKIKYFTAQVSGKYDTDKPVRQQMYWRALRTIPHLEIIEGAFFEKTVRLQATKDFYVVGKTMEEKRSDVNLAAHLVNDAHLNQFEVGVVVTNDTDLIEPLRITKEDNGLEIGIINPCRRASKELVTKSSADFQKTIRSVGLLAGSRFPRILKDSKGTITCPSSWR